MSATKTALVITSIAAPNAVLRAFAEGCREHGYSFTLIGVAPPLLISGWRVVISGDWTDNAPCRSRWPNCSRNAALWSKEPGLSASHA